MTDTVDIKGHVAHNPNAMKNTAKCVLVLAVIAIVCVTLLAVANKFLQVKPELDRATSDFINQIAPTGVDNEKAFTEKHIRMEDVSQGDYAVTDLAAYNKQYGRPALGLEVRALYISTHAQTGKETRVVEASAQGRDATIIMLVAYDDESKVSGIVTKSQNESFWDKNIAPKEEQIYKAFIGASGSLTHTQIAESTGATNTLKGIVEAVNLANDFVVRLGGEVQIAPEQETDAQKLAQLAKVSDAQSFMRYTVGTATVANAYVGDNGDIVIEAKGNGGGYGNVTMLVCVADDKVANLTLISDSFKPIPSHDSTTLRNDETLKEIFVGKSLADCKKLNGANLAGTTEVTESGNGLKDAVINALTYAPQFAAQLQKGA